MTRVVAKEQVSMQMIRLSQSSIISRPKIPYPHLTVLQICAFSISISLRKKEQLPPRPAVPEEDTFKRYLKGSGPGGQKINKTSSAVQLTHLPTGIVVKSQATRSRSQNENIARRILAEKVEFLEKGSESRVEKKRERASQKKRSAEKKSRRKYRKLADEKDGVEEREYGVEEVKNNEDKAEHEFREQDAHTFR